MKKLSVRKRSDGYYECRKTIDGRSLSTYGKTQKEAKLKMIEKMKEVEKENPIGISGTMTLSIAINNYLRNIKYGTIEDASFDRLESIYHCHIANSEIGKEQLGKVTSAELQEFIRRKCINEGYGESTVKKIYNLLKATFSYYCGARLLNYNPMIFVKLPKKTAYKTEAKGIETISLEEMKAVIAEAQRKDAKGNYAHRYGQAIVLMLCTGLRPCELRAIMLDDIDIENKTLHVCHDVTRSLDRKTGDYKIVIGPTKTIKSTRYIPLNDLAMNAVCELLKTTLNAETGLVITTSDGNIVSHQLIQRTYDSILRHIGLEHIGVYSLRHSFATSLLQDATMKGQIKEVSELLGHSNIMTTYNNYIRASLENKKSLLDSLNDVI